MYRPAPTACCLCVPSLPWCREKEKAVRGEERAKEREEREKQASPRCSCSMLLCPLAFAACKLAGQRAVGPACRPFGCAACALAAPTHPLPAILIPACSQKAVEREERERRRAEKAKEKEEAKRWASAACVPACCCGPTRRPSLAFGPGCALAVRSPPRTSNMNFESSFSRVSIGFFLPNRPQLPPGGPGAAGGAAPKGGGGGCVASCGGAAWLC